MPPNPKSNPPITFTTSRTSTLPLREVRAIQRTGYDAGWAGKAITDCPYRRDPDNPDAPFDRERADAWVRGFSAARTDLRIHRTSTPKEVRKAHGAPGKL